MQGGLLVAPILRKLILDREPVKVLAWADQVSQWPMKRIIPAHFENNIKGNPYLLPSGFTLVILFVNHILIKINLVTLFLSYWTTVSSGTEFRAAFKFLERPRVVALNGYNPSVGPAQPDVKDLFLLDFVSDLFTKLGIVAPSQVAKQVK